MLGRALKQWSCRWGRRGRMLAAAAPEPRRHSMAFDGGDVIQLEHDDDDDDDEFVRLKGPAKNNEELETRAGGFFRNCFYLGGNARETSGQLHDFIMLLYVGAMCKQQRQFTACQVDDRVSSLAERVRNGSVEDALTWFCKDSKDRDQVRAFTQSKIFLRPDMMGGHLSKFGPLRFCSKDLTVEEISSLSHALHQPQSLLAKLMRRDPLLTHYENMHTAVEHARLFLLRSELPIGFGMGINYADLADHVLECDFPDCCVMKKMDGIDTGRCYLHRITTRLDSDRFPFPSGQETSWRKQTIYFHDDIGHNPARCNRVEHLNPANCPPTAPLLVRRLMKTRNPFVRYVSDLDQADWERMTEQMQVLNQCEDAEVAVYSAWMDEAPELRALFVSDP